MEPKRLEVRPAALAALFRRLRLRLDMPEAAVPLLGLVACFWGVTVDADAEAIVLMWDIDGCMWGCENRRQLEVE